MAARLDDMFSFCVDPDKVAGCAEVRFIDNVKVRTGLSLRKKVIYYIYSAIYAAQSIKAAV